MISDPNAVAPLTDSNSSNRERAGYRILIADDHILFAQGLRSLLQLESFCAEVDIARDGESAITQAVANRAQIVLMDVQLPGIDGIKATRLIRDAIPKCKVIGLSAREHLRTVSDMFDAGASGYLLKGLDFDDVRLAIETVMEGQNYLSEKLRPEYAAFRGATTPSDQRRSLSVREREVARLIANGRSTKEVARELTLSIKTIESHRRNLMAKLEIDSVAELTKYAVREGLSYL